MRASAKTGSSSSHHGPRPVPVMMKESRVKESRVASLPRPNLHLPPPRPAPGPAQSCTCTCTCTCPRPNLEWGTGPIGVPSESFEGRWETKQAPLGTQLYQADT